MEKRSIKSYFMAYILFILFILFIGFFSIIVSCDSGIVSDLLEIESQPELESPAENPDPQDPDTSRFISVGSNGAILYSDDFGESWTGVQSGSTEVLRDAESDSNGRWVAVGYNGTFLYSSDNGISWDEGASVDPNRNLITINHINDVISYGTNKFIAIGEATGPDPYSIFRSVDGGMTWDRSIAMVVLKGIAVRNNTDFAAVGNVSGLNSMAVMLSYTSGNQWGTFTNIGNPNNIPATADIMYEAVYTNTHFVSVGRGSTLYSQGGGNWTTASSITGVLYGVAWSNSPGRLVSVGFGSAGGVSKGRVYYGGSTGSSWTEVDLSHFSENVEFLHGVSTNGSGRFVAVGDVGEIIYSVDTGNLQDSGTSWLEADSGVSVDLWGIGCNP